MRFKFATLAFDCGCKAWIFGMGIYNIGVGPKVPLVTRYEEAVNGSSVGVKMLGLWRMTCWLRTTDSDVGSRNFNSVTSMLDSSTPC